MPGGSEFFADDAARPAVVTTHQHITPLPRAWHQLLTVDASPAPVQVPATGDGQISKNRKKAFTQRTQPLAYAATLTSIYVTIRFFLYILFLIGGPLESSSLNVFKICAFRYLRRHRRSRDNVTSSGT